MILRLWHGWTTAANADAYARLLREEVFAGIRSRAIAGLRGLEALRREAADGSGLVEFVTLMRFDSFDAVREFAGADHERAVVPPAARALLARFDARSAHFDVPEAIRTARLLLRPWAATDAPALLPILRANVARLSAWIPATVATPVPEAALAERLEGFAADFVAGRAWRYAMLTPDGSRILGEADLFPRASSGRVSLDAADRVELGYWLDEGATGRGHATEATAALLAVAARFPGIARAEIRCDAANVASARIPERLGFRLEEESAGSQLWARALA